MSLSLFNRCFAFVFLFLAWIPSTYGQSAVSITLGSSGLGSLRYNGTEFLSYGDFRMNQIEFQNPDGSVFNGSTASSVTVDTGRQIQTRTYSWGTVAIVYTTSGNRLNLSITINNTSSLPIKGVWFEPLGLYLPTKASEYDGNTPLLTSTLEGLASQMLSYGGGALLLADDDVAKPLEIGFPWALDRPASRTFPVVVNTDRVFMYPDNIPTIVRPIPAGGSDQYHLSVRFGPAGSTSASLGADLAQSYAATFPLQVNWPDRRPIGMVVLGTAATNWPTNPRGWLLDSSIDVTTPAGVAAFQARILKFAHDTVTILTQMNAQAAITWDIEGEKYQHATTYIGDPRIFETLAPEMAGVADQYFKIFRDAGLKVGVCLRPQQLVVSADGSTAQQIPLADPTQLLISKVQYARQRWGATLFYVDSNVVSDTDPNAIDASIFATLQATFPDSLFIPEHSIPKYWAYTAPYRELRQNYTGTPPDVRNLYPNAFTVLNMQDGDIAGNYNTLANSVQQGDVLMFRGWFDDQPANGQVKSLTSKVVAPPTTPSPVSVSITPQANSLNASQTLQLSAVVVGTSNQQVAWSVTPALGTISASGLYTAPNSVAAQQTVTIQATSAADSTKFATANIALNPPATTIRVHSGGGAYTDPTGQVWSADSSFVGGSLYSTGTAISPATTSPLYQSVRYGDFSYNFAVPNGTYQVTLKMAEVFFTSPGQRVFNVNINGQSVLTNFDVVAAAGGGYKAIDRTFTVSTTTGQLQIQFTSVVNNAAINAIQITPATGQAVTISTTPTNNNLTASQTLQFTATVTGSTNTGASWTINPSMGSITQTGLYTAPAGITTAQSITVTATSAADPTKISSATIALSPTVGITVTPPASSLSASQTVQFATQVSGTTNQQVTWSLTPAAGTISPSGLYTAPANIVTQQNVSVTATSAADGTKTASATITLNPPAAPTNPGTTSIRMNSGGGAYIDPAGQAWAADSGSNGGLAYSTNNPIAQTTAPALYQSVHYGNFSYDFAMPNGTYAVTLKFAEVFYTSAGQRIFNVAINGQPVLTAMDVVAAAGGAFRAIDRSFTTTISNGQLHIQFTSVVDSAMISAIQVVPGSATQQPALAVAPVNVSLTPGQTRQYNATTLSGSSAQVAWSITPQIGSISQSGLYTAPSAVTQPQQVTITATSQSDSTQVGSATLVVGANPPIRVNAGGTAYTDSAGQAWLADTGNLGGATYGGNAAISGTTTPQLYQTVRFGDFTYDFAVPNGTHFVTLKFADPFFSQAGQRVFSVTINGQQALNNFDIVQSAGSSTAVDQLFTVPVVNGHVTIVFTSNTNYAMVNAIEID